MRSHDYNTACLLAAPVTVVVGAGVVLLVVVQLKLLHTHTHTYTHADAPASLQTHAILWHVAPSLRIPLLGNTSQPMATFRLVTMRPGGELLHMPATMLTAETMLCGARRPCLRVLDNACTLCMHACKLLLTVSCIILLVSDGVRGRGGWHAGIPEGQAHVLVRLQSQNRECAALRYPAGLGAIAEA